MSDRNKDVGKGCLVVLIPFMLGAIAITILNYLIQTYCS